MFMFSCESENQQSSCQIINPYLEFLISGIIMLVFLSDNLNKIFIKILLG